MSKYMLTQIFKNSKLYRRRKNKAQNGLYSPIYDKVSLALKSPTQKTS